MMKIRSLLEIIQAAHWTHLVQSEWSERGGIMLVAPPASFKTTFIKTLDLHHDALVLSDINVQSAVKLRDDIANERYRTLAFPEFEKIYARHPTVALNVEGHLQAFVEQGFKAASFEDERVPSPSAQCFIIGGIVPSVVRKNWDRWCDQGFARRFLWVHYRLKDASIIAEAIHNWKKFELDIDNIIILRNRAIPYDLTEAQSQKIRNICKHQRGQETPFQLLKKIASVLQHKEKMMKDIKPGTFMKVLEDFSSALTPGGAILEL